MTHKNKSPDTEEASFGNEVSSENATAQIYSLKDENQKSVDLIASRTAPSAVVPCTDVANSRRLVRAYRNDLRYVNHEGWYFWNGRIWQKDPQNGIRFGQTLGSLIMEEAACLPAGNSLTGWVKKSESRPQIESALKLAQPFLAIEPEIMDSTHFKATVENGTINLRTGCLGRHIRKDFVTKQIDFPYDPDADCPIWKSTITRALGNDRLLIDYFQRVCGYCLTGSTEEQVLFLLLGPGANGKSTVVLTLQSVMGPYARQAPPNLLMSSKFDRHPTELADLKGARLVVVSETPDGGRLNENLVKQLTGGDLIKARLMRQDFFEFSATHKLMIMSNHKPIVSGDDLAIWRRIHLIPFDIVIPKQEQDKDLVRKLQGECAGILNWCVDGCVKWLNEGLNPPPAVTAATDAYKNQQDIFSQFLDDCCNLGPNRQVKAASIYNAYKSWCVQTGEDAKSQVGFWDSLARKGVTKKRTSTGYLYMGIEIDHDRL